MKKLILVCVVWKGRQNVKLVETIGNQIPKDFLDKMAKEIGCPDHGTYSHG